ncbi:MAG TPA: hypothetical protein VF247_01455 [Candidatus Krumholzibacteria bacterium]
MHRLHRSWTLVALIGLASASSLAKGPDDCGANVARVVSVEFRGPDAVPANAYVGYEVTVAVEKQDASQPATVCYVVRDRDPWYKVLWAKDDVLAEGTIHLAADQTTATLPGYFSLLNRYSKITGAMWTPNADSYSGEHEAEVFIDIIGASGAARSDVHRIRVSN